MALHVYFDASGTADLEALSVAGFIAEVDQWKAFEAEWFQALAEEGVSEFHMREFAPSTGEYAAWKGDEPRRKRFIQRLATIINTHTLANVAVCFFVEAHRRVDAVFEFLEYLGGPYAHANHVAMSLAWGWCHENRPNEPVEFFVERGDNDQADLFRILRRTNMTVPCTPLPKRHVKGLQERCVLPFQACDFLAWESRKALLTVKSRGVYNDQRQAWDINARGSLMALTANWPTVKSPWSDVDVWRSNPMWLWADADNLARACLVFGVPRRAASGTSGP